MPDEPNGQEVVEEKQPEGLSTSNETQGNTGIPEETSERTKEQFEKLTQHNKELAEENRQLKESRNLPSVMDSLKPTGMGSVNINPQDVNGLTSGQVDDIYSRLVDENGYIDQNVLVQALKEANSRAIKAEQDAQMTRTRFEEAEENRQVRAAHKKYPQLDPKSDSFDEGFYKAVKNEMIGQLMNGQNDFLAAADNVTSWFRPGNTNDAAVAQKKDEQVRQIQATSAPSGGTKPSSSQDDLVRRTQQGDRAALMERLKNIGA